MKENNPISDAMARQFNLDRTTQLPDHFSDFLSGKSDDRVRLKHFFDETDHTFFMWFRPGEGVMGAPGFCHGGLISTILDESMGTCCWWNGHMVMTVNIDIRYKAKIPIHHEYICSAKIKTVRGRRIFTEGEILDQQGKVCAVSKGIFLKVSPERMSSDAEGAHKEEILAAAEFIELREKGLSIQQTLSTIKSGLRGRQPAEQAPS